MIQILIADDHPILREGLKRVISECEDLEVVDEAEDGQEAILKCKDPAIDVLTLDVSMPGPGFLEVLRRVKAHRPDLQVLVLSVHPEEQYAVRALRAGAAGYLTKDHSPVELAKAIRQVASGRKYVTETLGEWLAAELDSPVGKEPHETLSDREYQVFCLLGAGKPVGEIAETLALSSKTVSTYRKRIMDKMNLENNAAIIRYAIERDLAEEQ
jgi:DNA-binding NarL/FixJ family response regulator